MARQEMKPAGKTKASLKRKIWIILPLKTPCSKKTLCGYLL